MNTVLSSYNGLTLAVILALSIAITLYSLNGYSVRRRFTVLRGDTNNAHVVSRHYSKDKAQAAYRAYCAQNTEPGVFTISSSY